MSEMELVTGTMTKTDLNKASMFFDQHEREYESEEELNDWWFEFSYGEYYEYCGVIYEIDAKNHDPYDLAEAHHVDESTIAFILYWYNGGAGMPEVLDEAMKKLEGEDV